MNAQEIFQCLTPELALAGFADGDPEYDRNEDAFHAIVRPICSAKSMGSTRRHMISVMLRVSGGNGATGSAGWNCQRPVKLPIPFLPVWRRYLSRTRMNQRQQEQTGQNREEGRNRENGPEREIGQNQTHIAGQRIRTATGELAAPGGCAGTIGWRCED